MVIHHESIIDKDSFDLIKSGAKRLKFYLNDTKRQGLNPGDFIKYINKETGEILTVSVKHITKAVNSDVLAKMLSLDMEQIEYINSWFAMSDQETYGLLAVQIERNVE